MPLSTWFLPKYFCRPSTLTMSSRPLSSVSVSCGYVVSRPCYFAFPFSFSRALSRAMRVSSLACQKLKKIVRAQ